MKSPYTIGLVHCGISMMIYVYNQIEPDQSNGCDGEPWCAHSIASFEHTAGLQFSAFLVVKWLRSLPGTVSISNACFYHTRLLTPPAPLPCSFFLPAGDLPPSCAISPFSRHRLTVYIKSQAEIMKQHQPVSSLGLRVTLPRTVPSASSAAQSSLGHPVNRLPWVLNLQACYFLLSRLL